MVEKRIREIFYEYPEVIYGFTDIAYSAYAGAYPSALVYAVPYGELLTVKTYSEEKFETSIQDAKKAVEKIEAQLVTALDRQGINYYIPPLVQNNEEDLTAPFSFKYAAVNAGLGWIGKNDVVITEKYGPRVRLAAILIDGIFTYGDKVFHNKCPDSCRKCVDVCPYQALHDVKWDIDSLRSDIIDYRLCNEKRSLYIETHGRKNACGLCMVACPFGVGETV